jgi:hypothetical protein
MGVSVRRESGNVWVLRITGSLRKAEFDAMQAATAKQLSAGFRRAPVKFFPENQLAEARAWLD